MFDASDTARYNECVRLFSDTMQFIDDNAVPVCVLVNKMDRNDAVPFEHVRQTLQRESSSSISNLENVQYFATSLVRGEGYQEGLSWLLGKLKEIEG